MQWIPGNSSLPGNDLVDFLAKLGASLYPSTISVSLSPLISSHKLSLCTNWRRSLQSGLFPHQIPPVSSEELTLPRSARCALFRLRCNGHSTLLGTYFHRVGRAETPLCSKYGSKSQNLSHLVLDCPVLDHRCRPYLAILYPFLTSGPVRGELPDYRDFAKLIRAPIPRNESDKPTTTTTKCRAHYSVFELIFSGSGQQKLWMLAHCLQILHSIPFCWMDSLFSCCVYLQFHRFESCDTTGISRIFQEKC